MSEQFRSLRHLTAHVKQKRQEYEQLDDAIAQVSSLLDSLPEKTREVQALAEQAASWQKKITELEEGHQNLMEQCRKQRGDMQALMQKEQQERVTAREGFKTEQSQWQASTARLREEHNGLQRDIQHKRGELDRLEQELAQTVKAVLRR